MKLRNGKVITVIQKSDNEIATFECITYKKYMKRQDHYNKYRDPKNFLQLMNGGYLIIDSKNSFHWDIHLCKELLANKQYKDYEAITTYDVEFGDTVIYKKQNKPGRPTFKLIFDKIERVKTCKKEDGIFYIPVQKQHKHLKTTNMFEAFQNCYSGKTIQYMGSTYYIVDVKKAFKNKCDRFISNIKKDLQSIIGIVKRKLV